jgi:hypothetical protein
MIKDLFTELNSSDAIARVRASPGFSPAVTSFLGRLSLLHGVPFQYLVPDELLLQPESLKFFHVDADWIAALVNGALSVGRADQTLLLQNKSGAGNFMADFIAEAREIRRRAQAEQRQARQRAQEKPPEGFDPGAQAVEPRAQAIGTAPEATTTSGFSGFLLRSRLLVGWPGLEIKAFGLEQPLAVLRLDRVAPDVLFGLMDGQITKLRITQPPEGLHFDAPDSAVQLPRDPQLPRRDVQLAGRARGVFDTTVLATGAPGSAGLASEMITASLQYTLNLPSLG